jgi:precorrin-6Y C5,15-methyltransferase (decarboxylating)
MPNGKLFAIERNAQYAQFLQQNLEKFTVSNVKVVAAEAPQGLDDLPDPDRVFIGGAGGGLEDILDSLDRRLKADGVIVITAVTLDTLTKAVEVLEYHGYAVEVVCVNVAKTKPLTEYKLFEAQIPVYLITAVRSQDV